MRKTNADCIRSMIDEELAVQLVSVMWKNDYYRNMSKVRW